MSESPALDDRQEHANLETEVTPLPDTALSRRIEAALESIGRALSWVWLLLLGVVVLNVTLRYVFSSGRIELEEAQWHLYAVGFLGALAYCVKNDSHIRVDVLSERFSPRMRAWVDLYGILLLALPFCVTLQEAGVGRMTAIRVLYNNPVRDYRSFCPTRQSW